MKLLRPLGIALVLATATVPNVAVPATAFEQLSQLSSSSSYFPGSSTAVSGNNYLGYLNFDEATWAEGIDSRLADAPLGGLSGIEHVSGTHYIAISDDPAQRGPARIYHLDLSFGQDGVASAVHVRDVVELTDEHGHPFPELAVDPESIRVLPNGNLIWTSEGYARDGDFRSPRVYIAEPGGMVISELAVPDHHAPNAEQTVGIRHNNANEGLTLSADGRTAYTLNEGPLQQDGPANTEESGATVRLTAFDVATGQPTAEYPVEVGAKYPGANDRGLAEILAVGDGSFIVLERGFIPEQGNRAELYRITLDGATDVLGTTALTGDEQPVTKELLLSFDDNPEHPENVEGLAWGPERADGRRTLLVISDDNFNDTQRTLLHSVALDLS